jgi:large subunit ribosomal protein L25
MERVTLEVEARTPGKSSVARALRRSGRIPGIFYGHGRTPEPISVDARMLREAFHKAGIHAIFDIATPGGEKTPALLKDYQVDPTRDRLIHFDFIEVRMDQPVTSVTNVVLVGEATGVAMEGGVLDQPVHTLSVTALPAQLPAQIEVDVSELGVGGTIRVSDVQAPAGVTIEDDPDTLIASITIPTELEEPEVEEEAEGVEGEEGAAAEGEEGAAAEGEAPAESSSDSE